MQIKFANWMHLCEIWETRKGERIVLFLLVFLCGQAVQEGTAAFCRSGPGSAHWLSRCWEVVVLASGFLIFGSHCGPILQIPGWWEVGSAAASLQTCCILNNSSWDHSYVVRSWTHSTIYSVRGGSSPKKIMKSFLEAHLRIHFSLPANNL